MSRNMLLVIVLVALLPVMASAQFGGTRTTAAGATVDISTLKPCMIVGGSSMAPEAFTEGMSGLQSAPSVTLDGVEMALIGAGAKSGGGSATIAKQDGAKVLELSMGGQTHRFVVLSPGNFWLHDEVRALIPHYRRQPVPEWPYVDCNFPSRAPFGVNWKRPYLDWKPDEAWLAMMLAPPVVEEPEVLVVEEEAADEDEDAAGEAEVQASSPAPAGDMMGGGGMDGMGMDAGMMGGVDEPAPPA